MNRVLPWGARGRPYGPFAIPSGAFLVRGAEGGGVAIDIGYVSVSGDGMASRVVVARVATSSSSVGLTTKVGR